MSCTPIQQGRGQGETENRNREECVKYVKIVVLEVLNFKAFSIFFFFFLCSLNFAYCKLTTFIGEKKLKGEIIINI